MKIFTVSCSILLGATFCQKALAGDPNFEQRVKYNQSRTNWKIKEGQERLNQQRQSSLNSSGVNSYGVSSYGSSSSVTSNSYSSKKSNTRRDPSVSPTQALNTFMVAANRATSLDQLHPYAIKTTYEYWGRLNPQEKQKCLMGLKKWTYNARVTSEEHQPMVATVKLGGQSEIKGVNLWNENGVWKFSNVIK